MAKIHKDIYIGQRFDRWTVIGDSRPKYVRCRCECGTERDVSVSSLLHGQSRSCGCLIRDIARANHTTHGKYFTRLHRIWYGAWQRCFYEKHIDYQWYAERNITMCDEWKNDFTEFYDWAMSHGYRDDLTLDRINNDLGYSPDNCRFVTPKDQANNRRNNIRITYNGETKTLKQWAEALGIKYHTLYARVRTNGIPFEQAITY